MAAQMERLMGILEDTLVARMSIPGSVTYESDGNSMVVTAGRADEVLKMNHVCTDWTVKKRNEKKREGKIFIVGCIPRESRVSQY